MKTLYGFGLLAMALMNLTSCDSFFGTLPPESVVYNLGLSFQNVSGNDLVKGIGLVEWSPDTPMEDAQWGTVTPDLYVLDIIVFEPCANWDNEIYNTPARPGFIPDVNRPKLGMQRNNNGICYLNNSFSVPVNDCPEERILTYKLKNPYVFGDEAVHEFVTYWDIPKSNYAHTSERFAKCYRIEFDGVEIAPQPPMDERRNYEAIIILK
jgi:hypothetical protein